MNLPNSFAIKNSNQFPLLFFSSLRNRLNSFSIQLRSHYFSITLATVFLLLFNKSFFSAAWDMQAFESIGSIVFYSSLFPLLWLVTFFFINLLCIPGVIKPASVCLLMSGSFAAHFMDIYGVVIDKEMLRNVLETDVDEAYGLINLHLLASVIFLGIIPSLLVIKSKIIWVSAGREFIIRLLSISISLIVSTILILSLSTYYSSFFRNHKEVRLLANPLGFVNAAISLAEESTRHPVVIDPISQGARLGLGTLHQSKPVLVVFVVGETARASSFGLNGYKRDTTPLLAKQDIIYFNNFASCGTSTAISLPCMFSSLSRKTYSDNKAKSRHGLLDFISNSGIEVLWRDNNSGCKGTCDRVTYESPQMLAAEANCNNEACYDEILLTNLSTKIGKGNQFVVLHQKGSHGPAYAQRYPGTMQIYSPVCTTNQLQNCSQAEVVNAYDNTIHYTDYFLNKVILWLKDQQETHNTVMVYVSDHGESLGENNLYLHGMPYSIAPNEQKHVPFIFWASSGFYHDRGLDKECVNKLKENNFSHDNIFHSFLGLLDIETKYYEPELNIFSSCINQLSLK